MVEVLIGALVGGILSWIGSYFYLSNEFKNQIELNKREEINKEKSVFLTLKDEMEENRMVIQGYINFINSNNRQKIDFRNDNVNVARDQAWKQVRERVFLSKNEKNVKDISNFYKGIYGMQNADVMPKEYVYDILNDCKNLMNEIEEYINKLEKELKY